MNKIVGRYLILKYPIFSEELKINTYARKMKLRDYLEKIRIPLTFTNVS